MNAEKMEKIGGGACSPTLAKVAFGAAVASIFFPPAALLGWAAVGGWLGKCAN